MHLGDQHISDGYFYLLGKQIWYCIFQQNSDDLIVCHDLLGIQIQLFFLIGKVNGIVDWHHCFSPVSLLCKEYLLRSVHSESG